ncbi:thioesterase family protein [Gordonia sp. X0973]|uniref:acyl-CoA thioesterase domain-containing protein n=1 Tax=Gordonia sp. X0973 TaxID=2742602 RepID=UPI000F51FD94|nr:acyl-CoA thioesterase domain-containing protein [Gordonia sp. X0973]QKT08670.1 thioesterase family protein [Gordonia sp. X0973]
MANPSFFTESDGRLHATRYSMSLWAKGTLHGPAVCALGARAAESAGARDGFRPARFTVDMFRAARSIPTTTEATIVRDGGRVRVVQVDILQHRDDDDPVCVARSTTVFLKESANPHGERWTPPSTFDPPPAAADDYYPFFAADATTTADGTPVDTVAWTHDFSAMQGPGRKRNWAQTLPVVPGEEPSPFVLAVTAAESTSAVGNWGTTGIALINCDLTVALSRLPIGRRVGVQAQFHSEDDGISVSTTTIYDEAGAIGTGVATAVNNSAAEINATNVTAGERFQPE